MTKLSVKRPFLVFVGVVMVLVLGVVAFTKMKTDLLPSINMPYVAVITTYPGAAPEKVEKDVTDVLENTLGTVTGLENIRSTSSENYSMITMEFDENMDMDAAMARISRTLDQLTLPEMAAKPIVMEISADMMATMYAGVTKDGTDIYELTDFTDDVIVPELKRIEGVASVSTTGAVNQSVEIRLDQTKIDKINSKILASVDKTLAEAQDKITDGKNKLADGKAKIASSKKELADQQKKQSKELAKFTKMLNQALATQTAYETQVTTLTAQKTALEAEKKGYTDAYNGMNQAIQGVMAAMAAQGMDVSMLPASVEEAATDDMKLAVLVQTLQSMPDEKMQGLAASMTKENLQKVSEGYNTRIPQIDIELGNNATKLAAAQAVLKQVKKSVKDAQKQYEKVEAGKITAAAAFGSGTAQLAAAESALEQSETELENAQKSFDDSVETARENANLDQLLKMDTLAQLLSAQNFDMPAGYISEDDTQYLLKVGEEFNSFDELENLVLCKIKDVGDVKLADVAYITLIDNKSSTYAKIKDQDAVVVSIMKSSTAFTSEVSKNINKTFKDLEKKYDGLEFTVAMDQGDYIDLIVNSVMSNLIWGAVLAIFVLLIFLMDYRPTIVVGFSIPLSVLFAVVLMYFTDITFNVISLSGLALGIGMLVDNSIVSIENIYRLRAEGIPAARAAVMGAKQIAAAITASTLTTICVFLPILFTDGLTRSLMMDMCLTIAFSLVASLIVALTVVPSMSATLLRNDLPKEHPLFDKFVRFYAKILRFCLKVKIVPLALAIALLAFCGWQVVRMGIVIMPEMGSEQMSVTAEFLEDKTNEENAETADQILEKISAIKGVDKAGAMAANGAMSLLGISGVGSDKISNMEFFIMLEKDAAHDNKRIAKECDKIMQGFELEDYSVSESNMDMSSMLASGVQVDIYGNDSEELLRISKDVMKMFEDVGGIEEITNGQEDADPQINVIVDKNKAARLGLSVAQVYAELSGAVTTDKDATTLTVDNKEYKVTIVDETDTVNVDDLMNYEFETTSKDDEGKDVKETHKLKEFAKKADGESLASIKRENQSKYISVSGTMKEGYNATLQSRELKKLVNKYKTPDGYSIKIAGESETTDEIVKNMLLMMLLGMIFIYLIMVAQFQSLLSPFIVIFTIPLAFTGGLIGLLIAGEQMSMMSMMGFLILMGVVVNNGIVFVDYANQLRIAGESKLEALVETGCTRMRPILMTALTTILAMSTMVLSKDVGADMSKGMAIVVVGGLAYATVMTLIIVPVLYDIMFRKDIKIIDIGEDL